MKVQKDEKKKGKVKKNPKGRTVKRVLEFQLNETDFTKYAKAAAAKAGEVASLETEFEGVKDVWKAKIKKAEADRDVALDAIRKGTEEREVEATEVKNFDTSKVEYWFKGKLVQSRDLTELDRQLEIPVKKTKKSKKAGDETPATITDEQREIAAVHREETSRNGSWSVANGARG